MHKIVQKSDLLVNSETTELEFKKVAEKGKAAIYTVLGDVCETSDANGKDSKPAPLGDESSDNQGANEAQDSSQDSDIQLFGGKNFYMNNGNPFQMYMDLLLSRGKQMEISNELKSYTELAQGGLTLNDDGTISGDGSKGFANMISAQIVAAATQQSLQTGMDAAQQLSGAITDILGVVAGAKAGGNADEEQNNVDKLENALDAFDKIDEASPHLGNIPNPSATKCEKAIKDLKDNKYEVTKEGNHFGSVEKTVAKGKKSYTKETDEDKITEQFIVDKDNQLTVEKAIQEAIPKDREQIKKNFESQLGKAKKALKKKLTAIENSKERIKTLIKAADGAAKGTTLFVKQNMILAQAAAEAEKQQITLAQQALSSVEQTTGAGYKNAQDTLQNTLSELQGIMRNIRNGG